MSNSLQSRGLYSPWHSLGQNTGVGSLSLLQGIFPTQGSNPDLPNWRQILYQLNHKGSPRILEWVAYLFSSGSSWSRNQTGVSRLAGWFFTNWTIREALIKLYFPPTELKVSWIGVARGRRPETFAVLICNASSFSRINTTQHFFLPLVTFQSPKIVVYITHNFAHFIIASLCRGDCFLTLQLLEVLSLSIFNNTFGSEVSFALLQISLVISSPIHFLSTFQSSYTPCDQLLSHVQLFVTPWTIARQTPPSMGFSMQEY